jgi:hypothetical protein
MQKGKMQPVILGVDVAPQPVGIHDVATVTLEYEEVAAPGIKKTASAKITAQMVGDPALIRLNINREVLREWEELDAVQSVAQIVDDLEAGKVDAASAIDAIDRRGQTLVKRGSAQASEVIKIAKTIALTGGVTAEIKKSTVAYKARLQQGQS